MRMRDAGRALGRMGPYLVSHHPHCGPFRPDVVVAFGRLWCAACFVAFPVLLASVCMAWAGTRAGWWAVPWWVWIAGGLLAAAPQAFSFAGRIQSVRVQVAVKLCLGIGLGAATFGGLAAPGPLWVRLLALWGAATALQLLWIYYRPRRMKATCRACPQNRLRPRCEGLRELDDRLGGLVRLEGPVQ